MLLCYFSKQNVALFGLLPLAMVFSLRTRRWRQIPRLAVYAAAGLLVWGGLVAFLAQLWEVDPAKVRTYFFQLPFEVGQPRLQGLHRILLGRMLARLYLLRTFPVAPVAVPLVSGLALLLLAAWRLRRRTPLEPTPRDAVATLCFAVSLILFCEFFSAATLNQMENNLPFLFVALGLAHRSTQVLLPDRHGKLAAFCVGIFFVAVAIGDALFFHRDVNSKRIVLDMEFSAENSEEPQSAGLERMRYQVPERVGTSAGDLDELIHFLRSRDGNFLLVGDTSILYGLTGRPSIPPSLWFHPRLTIPRRGTLAFVEYQAELLRNITKHRVLYVILEDEETWMGSRLSQFPAISALLDTTQRKQFQIGGFTLIRLDG